MAITNTCVRFLLWAKKQGVSFEKTLTLGHLENLCDKEKVEAIAKENAGLIELEKINWEDLYSDTLFASLGADIIQSLDHSQYEKATFQLDLNIQLPISFKEQYSLVVDGGTLEHIFNFPQAIKNCMQTLSLNGHFLGFSPANNLMGHGFYQFSPELLYRIFSNENGFEIKGIFLVAAGFEIDTTTWYEVTDPKELKHRVTLTNSLPTYLMVLAKKIAAIEPFKNQVYQSDYLEAWDGKPLPDNNYTKKPTLLKRVFRKLTGKNVKEENLEKINPGFYKKRKY